MRNVFARLARGRGTAASSAVTVAELIEQARDCVARGAHDPAEHAYRLALKQDGGCYEGILELALLCQRSGRLDEAAKLFERACTVRPAELQAHACLALAYQALERWSEVRRAVERVLELKPDWGQAHNLLGVACLKLGNVAAATSAFARALALDPNNVEALNNLANVRKESGDVEAAISLYRRGLVHTPDSIPLRLNLGLGLQQLGRLDEAGACFEQVSADDPLNADAYTNLGVVRQAQGDAAQAERYFRRAVDCNPRSIRSRANLALFLSEHGALAEATEQLDALDQIDGSDSEIAAALAQVERACGRLQAAEARCRGALVRTPGNVPLNVTLGCVLHARGDLDAADACFARALSTDPSSAAARYNRATLALLRGDYRTGFELYESRFEAFGRLAAADVAMLGALGEAKRWHGQPLEGRRILLWAEQGYGDAIMMSRYVPLVRAAGAGRVVVHVLPPLVRLFSALPGVDEVIVDDGHPPTGASFDLHAPLMSLPHLLGTEATSVPPPVAPQLDRRSVERWRARFAGDPRLRVGVVWQGSPALRDTHLRNVAFECLAPLMAQPSVRLMSLQWTADAAGEGRPIEDPIRDCEDFFDTAHLVRCLDLVVTVDTAVAHLAASLGVETWLLNRHGSEWRWGVETDETPWYPSLRIFRQRTHGDWTETIDAVGAALRDYRPGAQ
jgi:tetratricopeptide (TPR) repeat protein